MKWHEGFFACSCHSYSKTNCDGCPFQMKSNRFLNFACFEAFGAYFDCLGRAVDFNPSGLEVWKPDTFGLWGAQCPRPRMFMSNILSELRSFAADITTICH